MEAMGKPTSDGEDAKEVTDLAPRVLRGGSFKLMRRICDLPTDSSTGPRTGSTSMVFVLRGLLLLDGFTALPPTTAGGENE